MAALVAGVEAGLAALARAALVRERRVLDSPQGARIEVDGRTLLNFASNDYLGLAAHPRLRAAAHAAIDRYGVGSGASPLVIGHQRPHQEAEERFAAFCRLPRALLFASGYAANLGILTALADRHADVFCDRLNHACLNDGALLSRGRMVRYGHGDLDALERALARSKASLRVVATDAVFSMDGDLADVPRLIALCERHGAWLVIDDAHGIGVLGERGRGTLDHFDAASDRVVYMATLGKALGSHGAFVAGRADVVEWILQRARTYIFSTALPASAAAAASAAIALLEEDATIVLRLRERIAHFGAMARTAGVRISASQTAIHPVVLGEPERALEASRRLLEQGLLVPAIRPPTVPEGTSRLRVSLSAAHAVEDLERLVHALGECVP
ncbi:MAG TPA: 8-amino-7-oxononanoate synthase [Usitatibacter sp.]|jgi:8-amino-7-oxononanoate synthase|nr:8-amino-7-oxononanoate synthase [Usitatibacter sp.]